MAWGTLFNTKAERRAHSDARAKLAQFQKELRGDPNRHAKALARLSEHEQKLIKQPSIDAATRSTPNRAQLPEPDLKPASKETIILEDRSEKITAVILDAVRARGVTVISNKKETCFLFAEERMYFRLWPSRIPHPTEYGRILTGRYQCTLEKREWLGVHAPHGHRWSDKDLERKAEKIADAVVKMGPLLAIARKRHVVEEQQRKANAEKLEFQRQQQRRDDECWVIAKQLAAQQHEIDDLTRYMQLLEANHADAVQPLLVWLKQRIAAIDPLSSHHVAKLIALQAGINPRKPTE